MINTRSQFKQAAYAGNQQCTNDIRTPNFAITSSEHRPYPTIMLKLVSQVDHNWSFCRFLFQLQASLSSNFVWSSAIKPKNRNCVWSSGCDKSLVALTSNPYWSRYTVNTAVKPTWTVTDVSVGAAKIAVGAVFHPAENRRQEPIFILNA
jgi:hypothetical protein